jgi:cephalosporin hydroxylase
MEKITVQDVEALGSDSLRVFGGTFEGGYNIQQVPDEIAPCINAIIDSGKPVYDFLEIGSAAGGTSRLFDTVFNLDNIVIIDDSRHPKHGLRQENLKHACGTVHEFIGNSQTQEAIDFIKNLEMEFDAILIDGDHSISGVVSDIDNYSPFLNEGGFLILHDTVSCFGVEQAFAWQKKTGKYVYSEFISKTDIKCGIGLLQKKEQIIE